MNQIQKSWFMFFRQIYLTYTGKNILLTLVCLASLLLLLVGCSWTVISVFLTKDANYLSL